ncbi:hypothetical protein AUC70_05925 [Methyloceanibacter stevinii]|uniref:Uncharacterized protein n=2 Tax=Methyloceanibacter stevinii TaxID=1774970 RepID=A0A1E3VP14_9HYPH|nr:hypothetical protein AUC70_05925 [Methyloceanibacter stevinii]
MHRESKGVELCRDDDGGAAMTFTLTRKQLYELVWSEPKQRLAAQIGISDVALAKHCRKLGIPVPERGYWNKLQAGKPVIRAQLPERDLVTINRVTISGELSDELRARLTSEPGNTGEEESIEVLAERLRNRLGKVAVPRDFSRAHRSIEALLRKDEKLREECAQRPYFWNKPRFDEPFERRRLRFLNGLFLAFEKVGARPWLRGNEARQLGVQLGDISLDFQLDEPSKLRLQRRPLARKAKNPQSLCLAITNTRTPTPGMVMDWQDEDGRPLEKQLVEIIVGMAVAGEQLHRQWLKELAEWERKRKEEERKEEIRRKADAEKRERERIATLEKARIDGLIRDAACWRDAANIREYVEAVRMAASTGDTINVEAWAEWALSEADKLDPVASGHAIERDDQTDRRSTPEAQTQRMENSGDPLDPRS